MKINDSLYNKLSRDGQYAVSLIKYFMQDLEQYYSQSAWCKNVREKIDNIVERIKNGMNVVSIDDIKSINKCIHSVLVIPGMEYVEHNILLFNTTPDQQNAINSMANELIDILQEMIKLYNESQAPANKIDYQPGKKLVLY